MRKVGDKIDR